MPLGDGGAVASAVRRRWFSMPSRADTRPFALAPLRPPSVAVPAASAAATEHALWSARTSVGLFTGQECELLRNRARRTHRLSPLVPAEAVLRTALQTRRGRGEREVAEEEGFGAAVVILAEQTLSVATVGRAAAWLLREGRLLAASSAPGERAPERPTSTSIALRPRDVVVLASDGMAWREEELRLQAAASAAGEAASEARLSVWLQCIEMEASEVWSPLSGEAPHPSWAATIFNEYGTHDAKE